MLLSRTPGGVADCCSAVCWWGLIPKTCLKHAWCYICDFLPSGQSSYRRCGWLFAHVLPFPGLLTFSVGWPGSFPLSVQASANSACWMPNFSPAVLGSLKSASEFSANNSLLCLCSKATVSPAASISFWRVLSVHWEMQIGLLTKKWNFPLELGNRRKVIGHFK